QQDVMRQFMTPVGWAQLYLKCSAWDREFKPKFLGISAEGDVKMGKAPLPGAVLADISKTLDGFSGSEKARREMKILIDPDPDAKQPKLGEGAKVAAKEAVVRPVRRSLGKWPRSTCRWISSCPPGRSRSSTSTPTARCGRSTPTGRRMTP